MAIKIPKLSEVLAFVYGVVELLWLALRDVVSWLVLPSKRWNAPKQTPIVSPWILMPASVLANKIRAGDVTSREVTQAYIQRAKSVNPYLNAIVAKRYEVALAEADKADELIRANSPLIQTMPFLGVPCTIKECFSFTGMPQTSGMPTRLPEFASAKKDAAAVARMRAAGFIPIGTTNISELCMWYESQNKVYGRTNNPYDLRRIVGGSSGGEGASVGSAMSVLGLGSDIGGSIRMPAFFNGVFGHKPSPMLVPNDGQHPLAHGDAVRYCTTGPICRYACDIWPALKVLASAGDELGDPREVKLNTLRVVSIEGYMGNLICQNVDQELISAQRRVLKHLTEVCGMEQVAAPDDLVEGLKESFDIWSAMLNAAADPSFSELLLGTSDFNAAKELWYWLLGNSPHTIPALVLAIVEKLPQKFHPEGVKRHMLKGIVMRQQLQKLLRNNTILLYPSHATTAVLHNAPCFVPLNFQYTAILNVMEIPVTQVPLGLAKSNGMPLGIQVGANNGQDKLCVAVALELEREFGGWVPPTAV